MGKGDLVPRIITGFSVQVRPEGVGMFAPAGAVNLSETGLCLRRDEELAAEQTVHLRIGLDDKAKPMEVTARVVWTREDTVNGVYYCGLGFKSLRDDQLQQIRDFVVRGSESLLRFLGDFPLFRDLSRDDCGSLLKITTLRSLERKEILYVDGTRDVDLQGLFIVQSGLLNIFKGRRPCPERNLAVVSAGQIFGEATLVTDQPHTATIMAVNDSQLIQINKIGFQLLRTKEPVVALKIMEVAARALASRLGRTTKRLFSPVSG